MDAYYLLEEEVPASFPHGLMSRIGMSGTTLIEKDATTPAHLQMAEPTVTPTVRR
jgi:hypothetical protein